MGIIGQRALCVAAWLAVWIVPICATAARAELGGIASGRGGQVWFTEPRADEIGRVTTRGITRVHVPTAGSEPDGVSIGPDGSAWFTEHQAGRVDQIAPDGAIHQYSVPVPPAKAQTPEPLGLGSSPRSNELPGPGAIVAGADGSMWFTEGGSSSGVSSVYGGQISRITADGIVTEFPIPSVNSEPKGLAVGADGNLWFTESTLHGGVIGRITPAGAITLFPLPESHEPGGLARGPDGDLWFTDVVFGRRIIGMIGQITPTGTIRDFPIPTSEAQPNAIAAGTDGDMWFTAFPPPKFTQRGDRSLTTGSTTGAIGRIAMDGHVTEYRSHHIALEITRGPGNEMWFTQLSSNALGRIGPSGRLSELPTKPQKKS